MTVDLFKEKFGYEIEGVWFPRVTSITSPFQKKWLSMRNAAEWGTTVHETIEAILRGEGVRPDAKYEVTIETFLRWRNEYPFQVADPNKDIEARVHDVEHGYAGTVDMIVEIEEMRGILELKTSTAISREHALQTAAYLQAYNKTNHASQRCQARWILRIDQYQECRGCFARVREKYGRARTSGGNAVCNHQWTELKGEIEFKELDNYERDFEAFLERKERWEWAHQEWLEKIPNYEKNIRQFTLL